jgi:hypothetical protein
MAKGLGNVKLSNEGEQQCVAAVESNIRCDRYLILTLFGLPQL